MPAPRSVLPPDEPERRNLRDGSLPLTEAWREALEECSLVVAVKAAGAEAVPAGGGFKAGAHAALLSGCRWFSLRTAAACCQTMTLFRTWFGTVPVNAAL